LRLYRSPIWLLFVEDTAQAVIYTWIFQHTRGSVLLAILLHAAGNLFALPESTIHGDMTLSVLEVGAKWLVALVVVAVAGPRYLARGPRLEALSRV
jgi:membrane protease YdiL (CAAX protease family)